MSNDKNLKRAAVVSALFEKENKRKPKNSKELLDYVKSKGGEEFLAKVDEYITQAEKEQAKKTQKALHGAKLNYLRNLKHQCAPDEEIIYYKKGGSVGCGCKKKEDGGEIAKALKGNIIDRYKTYIKSKIKDIKLKGLDKGIYLTSNKEMKNYDNILKANKNEEGEADPNRKVKKNSCGSKLKKGEEGIVAQFKAKCGTKMKKK